MEKNSHTDQEFMARLTKLVEANLSDENFGVSELAKKIGISRSSLHRKLKANTNKSISEFIREIRLKKAKKLLEEGKDNISEVAYNVGFGSPSYFGRCFHEYYGYAPGEVKKGIYPAPQFKTKAGRFFSNKIRIWVLLVLSVLFAVVLFWAGAHLITEKSNREEISIAILPFDNLSEIDNTRFLGDGIVEDLLNRLSAIKGVKVISRTSTEMFRDKGDKTIPEIGKTLGVTHVVEGTVQREENKLRISVQLINAKTDDHILSKQYDRSLGSFFDVQSEIAEQIASELSLALTKTEKVALQKNPTTNLQALEYYQQGRFHSSKRTIEEFQKGIEYYKKAIQEDPDFAQAYAGLADNYQLLVFYDPKDVVIFLNLKNHEQTKKKAYEMISKALELDPNLAEAYAISGTMDTYFTHDWEKAGQELQKAVDLNPNFSTAHQYYAELLFQQGKYDKVREEIDKAVQLDPFSAVIRYLSANYYYCQEQFDKAMSELKIALDLNPLYSRNILIEYKLYLALGDSLAALKSYKKLGNVAGLWAPKDSSIVSRFTSVRDLIDWNMNKTDYFDAQFKATNYALVGEEEKALDVIEEDPENRAWITGTNEFKKLRSNPRFIAIREKMGWPPLPY
ncbi:FlgO family outer membrane protein [Draconibacterium sp. IB214405]|uniref:FlgO family outer membrane protein n=1 Tax=Draconibacterium sp. IB214405 TaxID=3097352 RepID=UPI002A0D8CAA|nr:helix-turn-helix domain-containing protein [Draconibacterium sp. IB214405]MDX8340070.1 FlgO family outer membrane protein [Draconibacterium sp. IB214405]